MTLASDKSIEAWAMRRDYLSPCPTTKWYDLSRLIDLKKKPLALDVDGRTLAVSFVVDQRALFNAFELMALRPKELWRRGSHSWEPVAQVDWLQQP